MTEEKRYNIGVAKVTGRSAPTQEAAETLAKVARITMEVMLDTIMESHSVYVRTPPNIVVDFDREWDTYDWSVSCRFAVLEPRNGECQ